MIKRGFEQSISTKAIYTAIVFVLVYASLLAINQNFDQQPLPGPAISDACAQLSLTKAECCERYPAFCPQNNENILQKDQVKPVEAKEEGGFAIYIIGEYNVRVLKSAERSLKEGILTIYGSGTEIEIERGTEKYKLTILEKAENLDKIEIRTDNTISGTSFRVNNLAFNKREGFLGVIGTPSVKLNSLGAEFSNKGSNFFGAGSEVSTDDFILTNLNKGNILIGRDGLEIGEADKFYAQYVIPGDSLGSLDVKGQGLQIRLLSNRWADIDDRSWLSFNIRNGALIIRRAVPLPQARYQLYREGDQIIETNGNKIHYYTHTDEKKIIERITDRNLPYAYNEVELDKHFIVS